MNYILLPKYNTNIILSPSNNSETSLNNSNNSLTSSITHSKNVISNIYTNNIDELNHLYSVFNTYNYIYSNIPKSNMKISKLDVGSCYYELLEIISTFKIMELYLNYKILLISHFTENSTDTEQSILKLRNYRNDCHYGYDEWCGKQRSDYYPTICDIIVYDAKVCDGSDFHKLILLQIFNHQNNNGSCIIKIHENVSGKLYEDTCYILSSLYNKVYICKPTTINMLSNEQYIVCIGFNRCVDNININRQKLSNCYSTTHPITRLLNFEIPIYLKNKIADYAVLIGLQQLDILNQLVVINTHKNKDEKIDSLIKSNIAKSISWCEKYGIPHNIFVNSTNLFLKNNNGN